MSSDNRPARSASMGLRIVILGLAISMISGNPLIFRMDQSRDQKGKDVHSGMKTSCMQRCLAANLKTVTHLCGPEADVDMGCQKAVHDDLLEMCSRECQNPKSVEAHVIDMVSSSGNQGQNGSSTDTVTPSNRFVSCMAKCLGKSVIYIKKWKKKCGKKVKCWVKEVGKKALKCVPKCIFHETELATAIGKFISQETIQLQQGGTSSYEVAPANGLVSCLIKCLGMAISSILKWYKECKTDIKCWVEKVGKVALICLPKCLLPKKHLTTEQGIHELHPQTPVVTPDPLDDGLTPCLAKCVNITRQRVHAVIDECVDNVDCWKNETGDVAVMCLPKCVQLDTYLIDDHELWKEPSERKEVDNIPGKPVPGSIKNPSFDVGDDVADCMSTCLYEAPGKVKKMKKCWRKCNLAFKQSEKDGLPKNHGRANKARAPQHAMLIGQVAHGSSGEMDIPNDREECIASCLNITMKKVRLYYRVCDWNEKCWNALAGPCAEQCLNICKVNHRKSVINVQRLADDFSITNNDFAKCMAKCLEKDIAQVIEWFNECHTDVNCWLKKAGMAALKCVPQCVKLEMSLAPVSTSNNDFAKCMAKCLEKDLAQVIEWFNECHTDVNCWLKKAGMAALKCVPKCVKLEMSLVPVSPSNNDFAKCMAKCLAKDLSQVIEWYNVCHTDVNCWVKKAGMAALKCVPKCVNLEMSLVTVSPSNNDFAKCMAKCLEKDIAQVIEWYNECHTDVNCWLKRAGMAALKCVPQCVKLEMSLAPVSPSNNDFAKCMAKCLAKDIAEVIEWYNECHTDVNCWVKKAGMAALKCVPKCVKLETLPVQESHANNGFITCMAICLAKDIMQVLDWYKECQTDVKCWMKRVGMEAMKCVQKCAKLESLPKLQSPTNNDFAKCMAECLEKDIAQVIEWYNECHTDVNCWLKKAGMAALKCVPQCVKLEMSLAPVSPSNNDFAKCMAKCLAKDLAEVIEWYNECHTDVNCWVKKAGMAALKCVPKCVKLETLPVQESHANNGFITCMAICLAKDIMQVLDWYNECQTDVKCWMKRVGIEAMKCVQKCAKLESLPKLQSPTNNDFAKCMAECLEKDIAQVIEWYNECHTDVNCWLKKAGMAALKCVPQCVKLEMSLAPVSPSNNDFAKCMAKCLEKDLAQVIEWFNECHTDVNCWLKKAGMAALKCVPQCVKLEMSLAPVSPSNNDFAKCMAKCLAKDLAQVIEWYNECHTDVNCWMKKAGMAALKCTPKCVKLEMSLAPVSPSNNDFAKCMAKCLEKDLAQVIEWFNECHTDVNCWLKKAGMAALKCVPQCVKLETLPKLEFRSTKHLA